MLIHLQARLLPPILGSAEDYLKRIYQPSSWENGISTGSWPAPASEASRQYWPLKGSTWIPKNTTYWISGSSHQLHTPTSSGLPCLRAVCFKAPWLQGFQKNSFSRDSTEPVLPARLQTARTAFSPAGHNLKRKKKGPRQRHILPLPPWNFCTESLHPVT